MDDRSPPDRARFRTLYEQHARPFLGYALRRVVTSADAADTRLHRARHRLRAALTTDAATPERNRPNGHVGAGERTLAPDAEVRR
jgi:DNA-directed RNA polymerase specialized sigma24 family protein